MTDVTKTEFTITLGAKVYTLAFPVEAIWALEDATGQKMVDDRRTKEEILAEYETMTRREQMQRVVDMLWAGLITHHPELTRKAVGGMVYMRDLTRIQTTVTEAFNASISDGSRTPEADSAADPLAESNRPN